MQWPKETEQKDKQCNGQKKQNKRTNNAMAKRNRTKGQTNIHKTLHRKLTIEQKGSTKNQG
jgi:hypothetical protein